MATKVRTYYVNETPVQADSADNAKATYMAQYRDRGETRFRVKLPSGKVRYNPSSSTSAAPRAARRRNPSSYQRNPSRRGGVGVLSVAALGVFLWAGYTVLQPILHASAATVGGGAAPPAQAPAAPANPWRQLTLSDSGGVPLEAMGARARQSAAWIAEYSPGSSQNEYHAGAVFYDADGATWQWIGTDKVVSDGQERSFGDFAA